MHHHYEDIVSRIAEPPRWWDECAVPRWCAFSPSEVANIYARQVALVMIACQNCGERFPVAFSQSHPFDFGTGKVVPTLADSITAGTLHYGDPPNTDCCPAGASMNCVDVRVLEFWECDAFDWTRRPDLEVDLPDWDEPHPRPTAPTPEVPHA